MVKSTLYSVEGELVRVAKPPIKLSSKTLVLLLLHLGFLPSPLANALSIWTSHMLHGPNNKFPVSLSLRLQYMTVRADYSQQVR